MSPNLELQTTNKIEYVEPEDGMFFTYANNINYGFTPGDMRLTFGELIEMKDDVATIENRAQITLSWVTAKMLQATLGALIAQHEKTAGPINVPSPMLETKKM